MSSFFHSIVEKDMDQIKVVLAVGIGAAFLGAVVYKLYRKSKEAKNFRQLVKDWKACGVVSQLHIFPLKSGHGIPVEEAYAQKIGLVNGKLQDRFSSQIFLYICIF
jgi:hypothetical protein